MFAKGAVLEAGCSANDARVRLECADSKGVGGPLDLGVRSALGRSPNRCNVCTVAPWRDADACVLGCRC